LQPIHDYASIFLSDTPIMDVRSPIEFSKGAFPSAINHPLMSDDEREAVGTCYKEQGQDAAIALGHQLVQGKTKNERVAAWQNFAASHPNGLLYCFRGGLRSRVTQQWLSEAGIDMPFIEGGYKAMRSYLLEQLHTRITEKNILVLSGATGSGKTEVIHAWKHSIDLEGLANHRGSAFGNTGTDQPTQINFENGWSIEWLKRNAQNKAAVLFEDESRLIGRIAVMPEFLELSKQAPIVLLKAPLEERILRIRNDYFINAYQSKLTKGEHVAREYLDEFIRSALTRIQRRLGGERFTQLTKWLDEGLVALANQKDWSRFDDIIASLLTDYYDPMYEYQFQKKELNKVFEGNHQEVLQWLSQNHSK